MAAEVQRVKRKPGPKPTGQRDKVIVVRCWEAYSKWLARFVASERVETPILIDHALGEYARSRGFEPPPPR